MGKTTFLITVAKYLAIDRDIPTAVFSLEMSKKQVDRRLVSVVLGMWTTTVVLRWYYSLRG